MSNSVSDERACIFVATGISEGTAEPEETEKIEVRRLPLEEAFTMVDRGEIKDAMSVAGLLMLARRMASGSPV